MTLRHFVSSLPVANALTRELRSVVEGAFKPRRPKLADVQEITRDASTGSAAWTALARRGFVPEGWRSPAHCFATFIACPQCQGSGLGDHGGPCLGCGRSRIALSTPTDAPPTKEFAVSLASLGAETLSVLDMLAWQSAEAIAPWKALQRNAIPAPRRVCWCVAPKAVWRHRERVTVEPSRAASDACGAATPDIHTRLRAFERALVPHSESDEAPRVAALVDIENAILWNEAARLGLAVPALQGAPEGHEPPVGVAFSALPDPFIDRCDAWLTGCTIDAIERDGSVVVFVPA